ncbi:MAG TPA: heparan-alpha-glucosaminide N-acetyltransferase domain-containing protein [Myxococcales bacterium]|nr:heparan-alpha-glucosaminide N-acetyltransferase domain-containing protein [Myxococcales bacterium]
MNRRRYIDWMRGVAVLCMIEHHTFDAFLVPSLHGSAWDRVFRFIGGIAAPGFLFLAGLSVALMLEKKGGALKAARRGLYIVAGAYLFRFQEWALAFGGSPASDMLRIDVLNCIGVSLIVVALLWRASPWLLPAAAAAVVLATPWVWGLDLGTSHLATYLSGQPPRALFPLFPWMAHALCGAALGVVLARWPQREGAILGALSLAAVAVWMAVRPDPWRDFSPAVFLLRDTLTLPLLALSWLLEKRGGLVLRPLLKLGQHSLVVYWVHIELVYGRWFWRARGTLSLAAGAAVLAAVLVAMGALAYLVEWRPRPRALQVPA